ncbi:MAG: hypothetical protein IJS97_03255 [Prevotella sp.]|nr:hypothetical protein [Prevotella sp.]
MTVYIDGKPAALKQGTSFELRSENWMFTERGEYSLNIELPLGCKENDAIFGQINRKDTQMSQIFFDAEIVCDNYVTHGAVVITSITDDLVKVQYVAGRSYQNFYPDWDNTKINTLTIGNWPTFDLTASPSTWWGSTDYIALPWCNNSSGNIQNRADGMGTQNLAWHTVADSADDAEVVEGLSFQIRLYKLAELICTALGYTLSATDWQNSQWYYLYCFNTTPYAWNEHNWQSALPNWSVNDFFQELEKLLGMEVTVDHYAKVVTVKNIDNTANASQNVVLLEQVVDEYTRTVSKQDESKYIGAKNIGYKEAGHQMQNFYDCPWLNEERPQMVITEFETLQDVIDYMRARSYLPGSRLSVSSNLMHVQDTDRYYCLYYVAHVLPYWTVSKNTVYETQTEYIETKYRDGRVYRLQSVNLFGPVTNNPDSEDVDRIGFVPVCIDDAFNELYEYRGAIVFLDSGETEEVDAEAGEKQPNLVTAAYIEMGSLQNDDSNYNNIAVAFWFGDTTATDIANKLPRPWLDVEEAFLSWYMLSAQEDFGHSSGAVTHLESVTWYKDDSGHQATLKLQSHPTYNSMMSIEFKQKCELSFIFDGMPDVKSVFVIHGQKYLCAQIRADMTEQGMSQLKKGTFFRILE